MKQFKRRIIIKQFVYTLHMWMIKKKYIGASADRGIKTKK